MTTIYQRLSPLGFAEWVSVKVFKAEPDTIQVGIEEANKDFKRIDSLDVDDTERTSWNALAFRWLREEHKAKITQDFFKDHAADNNDPYVEVIKIYLYGKVAMASKDTYELASIACLEKAAEIIESKK